MVGNRWSSPGPFQAFIFVALGWSPVLSLMAYFDLSVEWLLVIATAPLMQGLLSAYSARTRIHLDARGVSVKTSDKVRWFDLDIVRLSWNHGESSKLFSPNGVGASLCIRDPAGGGGCHELQYSLRPLEWLARRKIERIVGYSLKA